VFPQWLLDSREKGRLSVEYASQSLQELRQVVESGRLDFYDDCEEVQGVIQEVFELNPHSVHTLNKHQEGIYAIALDNLNIVYTMDTRKALVRIVKVMYADNASM